MLSPIVLFVYNRPWHTEKTIEALQKNALAQESVLYVYSDGPKNPNISSDIEKVRLLIRQIKGFKEVKIIEEPKNLGLARSVINGVTEIINKHGKVIVLEDDLVTSPYFLNFMNDALNFYEADENIYSVTGFSFSTKFMQFPTDYLDDIYLNIRPMSWSWATWKSRWEGVDWDVKDVNEFLSSKAKMEKFNQGGTDLTQMLTLQLKGKLDSWYIRWSYNAILNNKLTIYPVKSHVNNIGHDSTGVHCKTDQKGIFSHSELNHDESYKFIKDIDINWQIVKCFNKAFNLTFKSKLKRFIKKILGYD